MSILVFLFMVLMHIVEDFHVQGILAKMKQKNWWYGALWDSVAESSKEALPVEDIDKKVEEQYPKYRYDYIPALMIHAFEWSMFIHIPLMVWYGWTLGIPFETNVVWLFIGSIAVNTLCHAYVDNLKANELTINLVQDQLIHLMQIVMTFVMFWEVLG